MPESTHDGKELTPSEEIKNIYFTMRGRDADNAETMFAAILHYLDAQAEKPKQNLLDYVSELENAKWVKKGVCKKSFIVKAGSYYLRKEYSSNNWSEICLGKTLGVEHMHLIESELEVSPPVRTAEKPKEVMFTKEQVKAIHTQWNRDLRSWLEKHTEA